MAMDTSSSDTCSDVHRHRVAFQGAEVIEYDAELPSVVRFAGAGCVSPARNSVKVALECEARGLELTSAEDQKQALTQQYIKELQTSLKQRGFRPISDDLKELETQRRVTELLLAWAAGAGAPGEETQETQETQDGTMQDVDVLDPRTLQRAQLAKKQLEGRVDDGYAFGRRFFAIETYVATLDSAELLDVALQRDMKLPKLNAKERAMVKALDRELLGRNGTALRSLTLRQLVTEAEARGLLGPGGEKARDSKGKMSKRAWVDMLRPVLRAEVRAEKIREKEEELLREQLGRELEQDMQREQHQRVTHLVETVLQRSQDGCVADASVEPENDPAMSQETQQETSKTSQDSDKARKYLEALAKTLCTPSETADDIVMRE